MNQGNQSNFSIIAKFRKNKRTLLISLSTDHQVKDEQEYNSPDYFNTKKKQIDLGGLLFKVVVWPNRHEHCRTLQKPPLATGAAFFTASHRRYGTALRPFLVTPPCELDVHGSPSPPVGRVVPRSSLEPLVGKLVPEVIGDVAEMVSVESECFNGFQALECRWRSGEPVYERAAETPRKELIPQKAACFEHAHGYHAFAQALAPFDSASDYEHHSLHRIPFPDYLLRSERCLHICTGEYYVVIREVDTCNDLSF